MFQGLAHPRWPLGISTLSLTTKWLVVTLGGVAKPLVSLLMILPHT